MRGTSQAQRWAARLGQLPQAIGVGRYFAGVNPDTSQFSPLARGPARLAVVAPDQEPDVFAVANFANSPLLEVAGSGAAGLAQIRPVSGPGSVVAIAVTSGGAGYTEPPTVTLVGGGGTGARATAQIDAAGTVIGFTIVSGGGGYTWAPAVVVQGAPIPGTGMRKFVDTLPGLCGTTAPNNLGQCIPVAQRFSDADTAARGVPTDGDYYELALGEYTRQLHSDLPPTRLRGYADQNPAAGAQPAFQYLGPLIIAQRNRAVRVKFTNRLGTGPAGALQIPTDTTYMGAGSGPDGTPYSQNRATLHLHGGNTPWISDGTPHQWTVPAGEGAFTNFAKGLSARDVPDMPPTGDGELTFYWTNQQSGRLMFYHDHAYGITRLNVYAGEAAGYLLVDPDEENELAAATVPGALTAPTAANPSPPPADLAHLVPLAIQDRTFVPDDGAPGGQLAATDPTWDVARWGGKGSLWFPHVYMPNQNPADLAGANAYGRWDYGPWFWPPQNPTTFVPGGRPYACSSMAYSDASPPAFGPLMCPGVPRPSGTPEGFMDTPVINGTAYPSLTVERAAYRWQMLNAANDRTWSFGIYYAATRDGVVCKGGAVADLATCTEVSMVPATPHNVCSAKITSNCICTDTHHPAGCLPATGSTLPLCATATTTGGGGLGIAELDASGAPLNGTGLPAGCWPTTWPTDGRDGGVPDPTTAGPPLIQIGAEGGLLPAPVVIPSTPTSYEFNRRSITVLNIWNHGLLLGPAERADVVVDFSGVPSNSALILYNDAPAPVPAFDPRVDYYTAGVDSSPTGGAPSTPAGYGPNTRTVMQIKVLGGSPGPKGFDLARLTKALPALFARTQAPIIVPEADYPPGNGGAPGNNYVRIQDTSIAYFDHGAIGEVKLLAGGSGYTSPPAVAIDPPGCTAGPGCATATAIASIGAAVQSVSLDGAGSGYTREPAVALAGGGGSGAAVHLVLRPTAVASVGVASGGTGYSSAPSVAIAPPGCVGCVTARARAVLAGGAVDQIVLVDAGSGYTSTPAVVVSGGGGTGAAATVDLAQVELDRIAVASGGAGYTSAPAVVIGAPDTPGGIPAAATAQIGPLAVTGVTVIDGGSGYHTAPTVGFSGGGGTGAAAIAAAVSQPLQPKTIQELFTLDYGRMNATLGVEIPFTNFTTQTTLPYGFVDPPTEIVRDGETQFWKVTHNGVDTHFIHFHRFDVQLINRVGWDGAIKPPDPNELGWKDTVRMNPLEDVIVALRPMTQDLPWRLPNSIRPLDVTAPIGARVAGQFLDVDPANNPAAVINDVTNFGAEYVWHCHILGHEENDMMRPVSLVIPPDPPSSVSAAFDGAGITVTWSDSSANETGFTIERAADPAGPWELSGTAGADAQAYRDTALASQAIYYYRVTANNVVGYTRSYAAPARGYPWVSADSPPVLAPAGVAVP